MIRMHVGEQSTEKAGKKLNPSVQISDYLLIELFKKDYGASVKDFYLTLSCADPGFLIPPRDWETGTVIHKKYIRKTHIVEIFVKVNHKDLMKADTDGVVALITEAILKTENEVKALKIKDFDVDRMYKDVEVLLTAAKWRTAPEDYSQEKVEKIRESERLEAQLLPKEVLNPIKESEFWSLIEDSEKIAKTKLLPRDKILIELLSVQTEEFIVGFEVAVRLLVRTAYHVNVLKLQKTIYPYVTDDSFLYFAGKLILLGEDVFYTALSNPESLEGTISADHMGEELLSVADLAYQRKKGKEYAEDLPRDIVGELYNYNDPPGDLSREVHNKNKGLW